MEANSILLLIIGAMIGIPIGWMLRKEKHMKELIAILKKIHEAPAVNKNTEEDDDALDGPPSGSRILMYKWIEKNGYKIVKQKELPFGIQFVLSSGSMVNLFESGKVNVQGKEDPELKKILGIK